MIDAVVMDKVDTSLMLSRVRLITGQGDIVIELRPDRAPRSVQAFLRQIVSGAYDGGAFLRVVHSGNDNASPSIQVIQANIAAASAITASVPHEGTDETGLVHEDGAVALPRLDGTSVGSAQGFFVCVGPQPALDAGGERTIDGRGFAVIGKVIEGMDVVRAIHKSETHDGGPNDFVRRQVPVEPPMIYRASREGLVMADHLHNLADDYWAFKIREFPTDASAAGIRTENQRLDGVREEDCSRRARMAGAMLKRAHAIDDRGLSEDDTITLHLLSNQLETMLEAYALHEHRRPRLFPFGFFVLPDQLAQTTPLDTFPDRDDFATRLRAIPAFFLDSLDMLQAGIADGHKIPRVLKPRILALLGSYLSPDGFAKRVEHRLGQEIEGIAAERLSLQRDAIMAIIRDQVLPSLALVRSFFLSLDDASMTDNPGVHAQPNGREYYRFKIWQQTSLDLSPDAAHQMGIDEVARIHAELDDVLAQMGRAGERNAVAAELDAKQAPNGDVLLVWVRALSKLIDGLLPRIFGRMPRVSYTVESISKAASTVLPPALAQPAPADRSMPGIFMLTALPEKCPLHHMVPLTLHEAWPGHLMQFAIANEMDNLPAFRRYGWADYNCYVEGWALYCERLGQDLDLYDEPADRFGMLTFDLWRAARLVVDTGIHWLGWSRERAIGYMKANTFLPVSTIESEVDRCVGMPAQALSYKIGERMISSLRREAENRLGDAFSLRDFHDAILAMGPVSLVVMREQITRWIERKGAR